MSFPYMRYFRSIEHSLAETVNYVEPVSANFVTYSTEFAKILLTTGSEVDVICKLICKKLEPTQTPNNINDYKAIICSHYPNFHQMKLIAPLHSLDFTPWSSWASGVNPDWWKAYNDVKHQRDSNFYKANLENTYNSLAGLLCLLLYYYQPELYSNNIYWQPVIFRLEKQPAFLVDGTSSDLPDFPRT